MTTATYEAPALQEIGDFEELTMALDDGSCTDFIGTGWAIVCFW